MTDRDQLHAAAQAAADLQDHCTCWTMIGEACCWCGNNTDGAGHNAECPRPRTRPCDSEPLVLPGEAAAVSAPEALDAAAEIMADATSYFIQPHYGREGLDALIAADWTITPPGEPDDPPDGWTWTCQPNRADDPLLGAHYRVRHDDNTLVAFTTSPMVPFGDWLADRLCRLLAQTGADE